MKRELYSQYHEAKLHARSEFACNTYLCTIPLDFPRVNPHWHEQMEIIYVKKGSGFVTVGSQQIGVSKGSIISILPGEIHAISADSHMEYENLIFSLSVLESGENDWCSVHLTGPLKDGTLRVPRSITPEDSFYNEAAGALDDADRASELHPDGYSLLVRAAFLRFFFVLLQHPPKIKLPSVLSHEEEVKRVLLYVHNHLGKKISLEEAATISGYSSAHFMRIFRRATGQSFTEYVNSARLSFAACLLRESSEAVSQISIDAGFASQSYFIRAFRRKYGITPKQFRLSEQRKLTDGTPAYVKEPNGR